MSIKLMKLSSQAVHNDCILNSYACLLLINLNLLLLEKGIKFTDFEANRIFLLTDIT